MESCQSLQSPEGSACHFKTISGLDELFLANESCNHPKALRVISSTQNQHIAKYFTYALQSPEGSACHFKFEFLAL